MVSPYGDEFEIITRSPNQKMAAAFWLAFLANT